MLRGQMFKHTTGWELNAQMLRVFNEAPQHCNLAFPEAPERTIAYVVRNEIAQDRQLVWC